MSESKPSKGPKPQQPLDLDLGEPPSSRLSSASEGWGVDEERAPEDPRTLDVNFDLDLDEPPSAVGQRTYQSLREKMSIPPTSAPAPAPQGEVMDVEVHASAPVSPREHPSRPPAGRAHPSAPPSSRAHPSRPPVSRLQALVPPSSRAHPSIPPEGAPTPPTEAVREETPQGPVPRIQPSNAPLRKLRASETRRKGPPVVLLLVLLMALLSGGVVVSGAVLWVGWQVLGSGTVISAPALDEDTEEIEEIEENQGIPVERGLRRSPGKPVPPPRPEAPSAE